jgi:1-acyl-sn-glycerol-3-phosphate acyltransferase
MERLEATIEGRTNELIAQARGEPVRPSVLVEAPKAAKASPQKAAEASLLP